MKTAFIILTVLSALLLFCTTVCGLWMRGQEQVEQSSINFHVSVALAAVLMVTVTIGVAVKQIAT